MSATQQQELATFLSAFGDDPNAVLAEIHAYWNTPGASPYPMEVYNHLVNARAETLSPERATFLKDYFAESFTPDSVTGYVEKHREPLIKALIAQHSMMHPSQTFFRAECDIMNLSGLNRSITAAGGDRPLANAVIRVMSTILRKHVEATGDVCAIRHGGDEMCLYVRPHTNTKQATIEKAMHEAQLEMAAFITKAGLRNVAHTKKGKNPGVGIGCSVAPITNLEGTLRSEVQLSGALEAGIKDSKDQFQKMLGSMLPQSHTADKRGTADYRDNLPGSATSGASKIGYKVSAATIESAFDDARYFEYRQSAEEQAPLAYHRRDILGMTPDEDRKNQVHAQLALLRDTPMNAQESRLVDATVALGTHIDFVTGLPMFGCMESDMVPSFRKHFGDQAKLVQFDFNNMGGGNELGSWVGNAMGRVFAQCVTRAMQVSKLDAYTPYLTSQNGGKFALLLPASLAPEVISELRLETERQLHYRSHEALPLDAEELQASLQKIDKMTHRYQGDKRQWNQSPQKNQTLVIADISSLKTRLNGANVVVEAQSKTIDLAKERVDTQIRELGNYVESAHQDITGFLLRKKIDQRDGGRVVKERKAALSPDIQGRKVDKGSFTDTVKLEPKDSGPAR